MNIIYEYVHECCTWTAPARPQLAGEGTKLVVLVIPGAKNTTLARLRSKVNADV